MSRCRVQKNDCGAVGRLVRILGLERENYAQNVYLETHPPLFAISCCTSCWNRQLPGVGHDDVNTSSFCCAIERGFQFPFWCLAAYSLEGQE